MLWTHILTLAALYTLPGGAPVTIPATFTPDGIIVRVTVDGRGLDFLLDTGSSINSIDPGVAHDLQLVASGKHAVINGRQIDASQTTVAEMHVGPLTLKDVPTTVLPWNNDTEGARIVGILGCDFIAGSVVGIDFGKATVTLSARGLQSLRPRSDCPAPAKAALDSSDFDGIFGRNALSPFAIFLDYTNRVVYFKIEK